MPIPGNPASPPPGRYYETRAGRRLLSVDTLPEEQRHEFLCEWDPVQKYGLTDDSVFYRVTDAQFVKNGQIAGNSASVAGILNHLALETHPLRLLMQRELERARNDEERRVAKELMDGYAPYVPVEMQAADLPQPSLNVMYGSEAFSGVLDYAQKGSVVVSMTLGDLRKAGGGTVFADIRSLKNNPNSIPLIVTLSERCTVPVKIEKTNA